MEPQTPESMTSSLYIVQEFMSGDTLKVQYCAFANASVGEFAICGPPESWKNVSLATIKSCAFVWAAACVNWISYVSRNCPTVSLQDTLFLSTCPLQSLPERSTEVNCKGSIG